MPASITIGAVSVNLLDFTERAREYRGELTVAFDNTLLDGRDRPRRTWEGKTDWITPEAENALRGQIDGGPVACSGLVLYGEGVYCIVTIDSAMRGPDVSNGLPDWTNVNSQLSLTFKEVGIAPPTAAVIGAYLNVGGVYVPVVNINT